MKNLTEKVKDFFNAFWAWASSSRSIYVNINTPEYREALNHYIERRAKENEEDWTDGFFAENSFCSAYVLYELKERRLKRRKLRYKMYHAFFMMIFFWVPKNER